MVKVFCFRNWKCGAYKNFQEAEKDEFVFCLMCANFLKEVEKK